jgi:hypothetical protein
MRLAAVLIALAGCEFQHGRLSPFEDAPRRDDAAVDALDAKPDAPFDAPRDAPPACVVLACTAAGGTCQSGVCVIDNNLSTGVTCPSGMPCKVICDTSTSCQTGLVDCGEATTCEVICSGTSACQDDGVDCGAATTCHVSCIGTSACQGGAPSSRSVECRASVCTVTCQGTSACQDGIDVDTGGTCTSHCCGTAACQGGVDTCMNDNDCS